MTMGERIKARRKAIGMSADALAEAVGKDRSIIFKYEKDEVSPTVSVIANIASVLRVSPAYLVGWINNPDVTSEELAQMDEPIMVDLIRSASRLPETGKATVVDYARFLGRKPEDAVDQHD